MTDNEQIIEIAKLDGEDIRPDGFHWQKGVNCGLPVESVIQNFKPYLTSRDAIVPCCEKQPKEVRDRIAARVTIFSTAKEICQVLLEEVGLWH